MPLFFWGDEDGAPLPRASYFESLPRSVAPRRLLRRVNDGAAATCEAARTPSLNRQGVRIGTAEIYRVARDDPSRRQTPLVVNLDLPDGKFFMPLFVVAGDPR